MTKLQVDWDKLSAD